MPYNWLNNDSKDNKSCRKICNFTSVWRYYFKHVHAATKQTVTVAHAAMNHNAEYAHNNTGQPLSIEWTSFLHTYVPIYASWGLPDGHIYNKKLTSAFRSSVPSITCRLLHGAIMYSLFSKLTIVTLKCMKSNHIFCACACKWFSKNQIERKAESSISFVH